MQFQVSSNSETAAQYSLGIVPHPFSLVLKSPGFPVSLPWLEQSSCQSLVLKKTGLTCASSIAVSAPGEGLPKPLENEEEHLHTPQKLVLKFLLDSPIKSKKTLSY